MHAVAPRLGTLILAAALFASCGGDSSDTQVASSEDSPAAEWTRSSEPPLEALTRLAALEPAADYVASYDIQATDSEGGWSWLLTVAHTQDQDLRHLRDRQDGQSRGISYVDATRRASCDGGGCSEFPTRPGLGTEWPLPPHGSLEQELLVITEGGRSLEEVEPRSIAGQGARCFSVGPSAQGGSTGATLCVHAATGVILLIEGSFPGFDGTLIATEFRSPPCASDFNLPGTPAAPDPACPTSTPGPSATPRPSHTPGPTNPPPVTPKSSATN